MLLLIIFILSVIFSLTSMVVLLIIKTKNIKLWLSILICSLIVFFVIAELFKKQF